MSERHPPHTGGAEEDLKPDILEEGEDQPLPPDEAIRRERDTYGESDFDPNREDIEDEHHAGPDEHL
jgi:hypothetical protein